MTGANQTFSSAPASAWSDARGTGAAWTGTIHRPDERAWHVGTMARTIAVDGLSVTAGTGSDPTTTTTITGSSPGPVGQFPDPRLRDRQQQGYLHLHARLLAAHPGQRRSNYTGTVGSSGLNPYTSTLTLSIS